MKLQTKHSEIELIEAIKQEDNQALKLVYNANYHVIAHFIVNNNGTEQDAKDIYQESFVVFYEKIRDVGFELNCKIKTFIYSIARRLWLKRLGEKNKVVGKIDDFVEFIDLDGQSEEEIDETEQQFRLMEESLQQLGEPCKSILKDYYINKLNMQKIAKKMGYTNADNAKTQKYKCLMRLKKLFFKKYKRK